MPTRRAEATWEGDLKGGKGTLRLPSQDAEHPFTRGSRFEDAEGTNPEELIGSALAGCFSMFLSGLLSKKDSPPERISTTANVTIEVTDDGPAITQIALVTEADVPGLADETFQDLVREAKQGCPVSKALAGTEISVNASLTGS